MNPVTFLLIWALAHPDWGFFGHRLINRAAVFTLPTEMIGWYKPHIDYITEHAVDPDKRRYATKHEAVRHYIDLDHWGDFPFDDLPRTWDQALALNLDVYSIAGNDTTFWLTAVPVASWSDSIADFNLRLQVVRRFYLPHYFDDSPAVPCDSLSAVLAGVSCTPGAVVFMKDALSPHGILPYHLPVMQRQLTKAFEEGNYERILRVSAELGHYIADACVPLHTTENYNGQLTNQVGIHAFWESRIPELFAIEDFDMVVGTAEYIKDPRAFFWELVFSSHREVDKVLSLEKSLSETFPSDQQFCYEDRLNQNVRTQCADYALAYHLAMNKMVEDRFRVAVKALGDAWYTAWVDAGQPDVPSLTSIREKTAEDEDLDKAVRQGRLYGREHEH